MHHHLITFHRSLFVPGMGMFFLVLAVLTLSPKEAAVDPLAVATVYGSADPSQAYAMRDVRDCAPSCFSACTRARCTTP